MLLNRQGEASKEERKDERLSDDNTGGHRRLCSCALLTQDGVEQLELARLYRKETRRGRLAVSLVSAPLLLVKGVPREARQISCVACGTRQADPDGRLEAASSLNASVSKVRGQSPTWFDSTKPSELRFLALLTEGNAKVHFHRESTAGLSEPYL
jgi:hypothetical protein